MPKVNITPSIIGHLQSRLRTILKDPTIKLGEIVYDDNISTGIYNIVFCKGFHWIIDDNTNHNTGLIQLRIANNKIYWLSLVVNFNIILKRTDHLSITYYDENFNRMFRAEWANNKSSIEHAQPHWHIHNKKPDLSSPLWDADFVKSFPEEVEDVITDNIKNIHFAMSSSWDKNSKHIHSLTESQDSELLSWVNGVIKYSNQQLTYLHDKTKA